MKKINWDEFVKYTEILANKIIDSKFNPDMLVAIARGGWIPARFLSKILNVEKLASIGMSYQDKTRTEIVTYSVPLINPQIKSILLIEDRLESAKSLNEAKNIFEREGLLVCTCSLFVHSKSIIIPDYYIESNDEEIIFPWEL